MALLKAEKLSKVFGGLKAVSKFEMEINQGELIGLIGPNGAGKTTAFNLLTGVYVPTTGTIEFDGKNMVGLKPYKITQSGVARTFQNIRLFSELSVLDNVKIAYHSHVNYGILESVMRVGRYFKEEDEFEQKAIEYFLHCTHDQPLTSRCSMATASSKRLLPAGQQFRQFLMENTALNLARDYSEFLPGDGGDRGTGNAEAMPSGKRRQP